MPRSECTHYGQTRVWALHQHNVSALKHGVRKYTVTKRDGRFLIKVRGSASDLPMLANAIDPKVAARIFADMGGPFNVLVETEITGDELVEFTKLMMLRSVADVEGHGVGETPEAKDLRLLRKKAEEERNEFATDKFQDTLSIVEKRTEQLSLMCGEEGLGVYSDKEVQRAAAATAEALGGLINELTCTVGKLVRAVANDARPSEADVPRFATRLVSEGLLL
jgi:hypothetical protein